MNSAYRELIGSNRVSTPTRRALEEHGRHDDPAYAPCALDAVDLDTLRALVDRIIPQTPAHRIDLAARIDQRLAQGIGDGWRFASLPSDSAAYRTGLRTLDRAAGQRFGMSFCALRPALQDEVLTGIAAGAVEVKTQGGDASPALDGAQLRNWFEEVRADAVRLFVAAPGTMAHVGYSGIANGGDGLPKSGFVTVGLGEREDWEPRPSIDELQ